MSGLTAKDFEGRLRTLKLEPGSLGMIIGIMHRSGGLDPSLYFEQIGKQRFTRSKADPPLNQIRKTNGRMSDQISLASRCQIVPWNKIPKELRGLSSR